MILALAAAVAAAQPAPCPDLVTTEAFVCRALRSSATNDPEAAAESFEQAALQSHVASGDAPKLWAAAGNMWIAAGRPAKAALALDKAIAGNGLSGAQRGEALLDRARAAEAQNDLKTARAKAEEASLTISDDPFLWYFSAALAIREGNAPVAKSSIDKALALAPADPLILFEAGHVAKYTGDDVGARHYWQRAVERDPSGAAGKAARDALALLPPSIKVQSEGEPTR